MLWLYPSSIIFVGLTGEQWPHKHRYTYCYADSMSTFASSVTSMFNDIN